MTMLLCGPHEVAADLRCCATSLPANRGLIGVLLACILRVDNRSLVRILNVMTVAESILGPYHTLELARGHSRMQVWSSEIADG